MLLQQSPGEIDGGRCKPQFGPLLPLAPVGAAAVTLFETSFDVGDGIARIVADELAAGLDGKIGFLLGLVAVLLRVSQRRRCRNPQADCAARSQTHHVPHVPSPEKTSTATINSVHLSRKNPPMSEQC